jgi:predicted ATPase
VLDSFFIYHHHDTSHKKVPYCPSGQACLPSRLKAALPAGRCSALEEKVTGWLAASQVTGTTFWLPLYKSYLAEAHAELGKFVDAWRCVGEATRAVAKTKETMFEAEVYRIAGEIALKSPQPDVAKAQEYFERALAVARKQQAKSWELRVAMSIARFWRDQGRVQQARELLDPVYGWFTEGFDTRDSKEAKALWFGGVGIAAGSFWPWRQ